jgi:membrane protein DedA with SNARE-associated domain
MTDPGILIPGFSAASYAGIFGISLLANIVIPVPEEAVLIGIGYASRATGANFFLIVLIIITGLLISDLFLYALSKRGNKYVLMFYTKVFARRLEKRRAWLENNITNVIFYSRFLLQLRFLGPFLAGQTKASLRTFLTYELAALVIYVPLVTWVGWYFHSRVTRILQGIGIIRNILFILIIIAVLYSLYRSVQKRTTR